MPKVIKNHRVVFYYDQPLVAVSRDEQGLGYISLMVNSNSLWLACQVTESNLDEFLHAGKDLLSIMKESTTSFSRFEDFYLDETKSYPLQEVAVKDLLDEWFPGPGFRLKPQENS